jgi:hypothetical protein
MCSLAFANCLVYNTEKTEEEKKIVGFHEIAGSVCAHIPEIYITFCKECTAN